MDEVLLVEMGQRIFERRRQLMLTQEQLAEQAGLTPQTVSTAELGKKAMRPENIIKMCDALEVSTDYLLRGKISTEDESVIYQKMAQLPPGQYRHLEDIINSFLAAVEEEKKA